MAGKLGMKHRNKRRPVGLKDMAYVWKTKESDEERPDTPAQEALRRMKESNPDRYYDRLQKLRAEYQAESEAPAAKVTETVVTFPEDEGEDRVREMIQGLLREARGNALS